MSLRSLTACTIVVLSVGLSAAAVERYADDPIAVLNQIIQERFTEVDNTFGLRRIVVIGDTPHRFQPETVSEADAVRELDEAHLRVAMYMAGRRVLDVEPDLTTKVPFALNRRVIFGPIAVTAAAALPPLPEAVDLIDESRLAFRTLERRERHDFERGGVRFTARAVRASSRTCLTCHKDRKIGEPLGVVIYACAESN
jgi:hypothetical protein